MKILVINGPNINLILLRNKDFYGDIEITMIEERIREYFPEIDFSFYTTNNENDIITKIQQVNNNYDGLVINPGAFTHTSIGIRDALEICVVPKIEVHLSNLSDRDEFRKIFLTTSQCDGYISGVKDISYFAAVFSLIEIIKRKRLD